MVSGKSSGEQSRRWAAGGVRVGNPFTVMKAFFLNLYQHGRIGFRAFCAHIPSGCQVQMPEMYSDFHEFRSVR